MKAFMKAPHEGSREGPHEGSNHHYHYFCHVVTMLAVVKEKPEPGVVIKNIPEPKPRKDEVLVKILYASICGTDVSIYDWTPWVAEHLTPPIVIGHEIVGEIIDINGDAPGLKKGDIVSSETHIFDDTCYQCLHNRRHVCENVHFFGYERDGGFAEFATIPIRTTWKNNPSIPLKAMSVQEPLGNSVNAVTKAHVAGRRVLVLGLGPTGTCAAAVAKAYGARDVVGIDPVEYRRRLTEKFANVKTSASYDDSMQGSFDVVLEMSGAATAIRSAFDAVRIAGTIIAFGIPKKDIEIGWGSHIINKEIYIKSVFGRKIWESWHQTTQLLKEGIIDLERIITHEFELADFEDAMAVMKSGESGKVLLKVADGL